MEGEDASTTFDIFCYFLDSTASIEAHLGHIFCNNQVVFTKEINSIISRKLSKVVLLMFFVSRIDFSTSRCKILQSFVIIDFFILRQKNKSNLINASMIYCGMVNVIGIGNHKFLWNNKKDKINTTNILVEMSRQYFLLYSMVTIRLNYLEIPIILWMLFLFCLSFPC